MDSVPEQLRDSIRAYKESWLAPIVSPRHPSGLIYHYCDATALLSIFETKNLWATGARYLNDRLEIVSILRTLPSPESNQLDEAMNSAIAMANVMRTAGADMISSAIGLETFVACFSEDPDILGQWRAYANDGLGFAIGFNAEKLRVLTSSAEARFHQMIYAGDDEDRSVTELLEGFASRIAPYLSILDTTGWKSQHAETTARQWVSRRLSECLIELSYRCKHRSFKEEKEWRIIAPPSPLRFRNSHGRIVPYVLLDMASLDSPDLMPIEHIVIGPKAHRLDTERALMYLAERYGYGHAGFDISKSDAPYR